MYDSIGKSFASSPNGCSISIAIWSEAMGDTDGDDNAAVWVRNNVGVGVRSACSTHGSVVVCACSMLMKRIVLLTTGY